MLEKGIQEKFNNWLSSVQEDSDLISELNEMKNDDSKIEESFFKELSFGTGGLRGVIGVGTNRINIYTVRKASQGLANYVNKHYKNGSIAISYDSRIKSDLFAKTAASVFAGNGIKVYIYSTLNPTPCLSYAVRELKCSAGVMVTASHNPSKYNGYKVYGSDGCQITTKAADEITQEISVVDPFKDVKNIPYEEGIKNKKIEYISPEISTNFIERVKKESVLNNEKIDRNVKIVYSPLHGTGYVPVTRILKEVGFNNVVVVEEQKDPDGLFTTCPFPNPEIKEAMQLGMEYAKRENADLLLATDPDCDRVGIAVKDGNDYRLLTGNETGILLLNFICGLRTKNHNMPKDACAVKTIVTTDMAEAIAKSYDVKLYNVLTGFKYIGDVIKFLEENNQEFSYIFGFEESYGYLSGSYVRDKDAVNGSFLICEMFAYYKTLNISLIDKLNELYKKYGFYLNKLDNFSFEGVAGFQKMKEIMLQFRESISKIGGIKVVKVEDYLKGLNNLPKSDVIKFYLENGSTVVVRPSGTEPKLKLYTSIKSSNKAEAENVYLNILNSLKKRFE